MAGETQRSVPLVRIESEPTLFDREAVLGRDVSSVFPSEAKRDDSFDHLGAVKFVTEAELVEIKQKRGERPEDGTAEEKKPLAQVLADNKQAKEDEFQARWKQMKVGKNRPLDDEEAEFFDEILKREEQQEEAVKEMEKHEFTQFQVARAELEDTVKIEAKEIVAPELLRLTPQLKRKKSACIAGIRLKPTMKAAFSANKKICIEDQDAAPAFQANKADSDDDGGSGGLLGLGSYGSDDESD